MVTAVESPYLAVVADEEGTDDSGTRSSLVSCESGSTRSVRHVVTAVLSVVLLVALWTQRDMISGAVTEMGAMSRWALVMLVMLAGYERWSRADIVRRLLGVSIREAITIHDVGNAISKGVPMGGALGTAARWSIARDRGISSTRFATMLIAYGIATTFVSWFLPFAAIVIDLTQRPADRTDVLILAGIGIVVTCSAAFWAVVLHSARLERWATWRLRGVWARLARKVSQLDAHDPAASIAEIRRELCTIVRNPWFLLVRTIGAQLCSALILLVALRAVGVTGELGLTEFARIFFVTHLLGSFAPTPGGVGVIEAGMTGALAAAGVDTTAALAGVLVYRLLTYITPIACGAILYVVWRSRRAVVAATAARELHVPVRVRVGVARPATLAGNGPSIDTVLPYFSRTADQGVREPRYRR